MMGWEQDFTIQKVPKDPTMWRRREATCPRKDEINTASCFFEAKTQHKKNYWSNMYIVISHHKIPCLEEIKEYEMEMIR